VLGCSDLPRALPRQMSYLPRPLSQRFRPLKSFSFWVKKASIFPFAIEKRFFHDLFSLFFVGLINQSTFQHVFITLKLLSAFMV
jgi:hypothetical protein